MHWTSTLTLACGCVYAHVLSTDKTKRSRGDTWVCDTHGEQEIVKSSAVTA